MNKTAKGALAAGTAAFLLAGGAGTLAYWNDTQTISGTSFTAGDLKIDASSCSTGASGWTVSNAVQGVTNAAFAPGTDKIVPGDRLTKTCTVSIVAVGKNLKANLGVTGGAASGTMAAGAYTVNGTFTLGGQPLTTITSANNGQTVNASIVVDFPLNATTVDNASKTKTISLADYTVTATQQTSTP